MRNCSAYLCLVIFCTLLRTWTLNSTFFFSLYR
jgi:hypothetical protein